jgi:hypothetical protein
MKYPVGYVTASKSQMAVKVRRAITGVIQHREDFRREVYDGILAQHNKPIKLLGLTLFAGSTYTYYDIESGNLDLGICGHLTVAEVKNYLKDTLDSFQMVESALHSSDSEEVLLSLEIIAQIQKYTL